MTDTLLVRLKPYDPRRGHVLRRYTYAGIKFQEERGWYRVERPVAEYLRAVREVPSDRYAPLAFDVCTEAEANGMMLAAAPELLEALEAALAEYGHHSSLCFAGGYYPECVCPVWVREARRAVEKARGAHGSR